MNVDTDLSCIDCHRPLAEAEPGPAWACCPCGLNYSYQLLDVANRDLWQRAAQERLFHRVGDQAWLTTPLDAIHELRNHSNAV